MKLIKKLFSFFWDKSLFTFLIIGGVSTILSWVTSYCLTQFAGLGLFAATAIPYAVYSVPSFILNRKFSFKSKAPLGPSIARFATIITVCFLLSYSLNNLVVPWMRQVWFPGINDTLYLIIRLVGIQVVFTVLNYVGQRLWAFKSDEPAPDAAPNAADRQT